MKMNILYFCFGWHALYGWNTTSTSSYLSVWLWGRPQRYGTATLRSHLPDCGRVCTTVFTGMGNTVSTEVSLMVPSLFGRYAMHVVRWHLSAYPTLEPDQNSQTSPQFWFRRQLVLVTWRINPEQRSNCGECLICFYLVAGRLPVIPGRLSR